MLKVKGVKTEMSDKPKGGVTDEDLGLALVDVVLKGKAVKSKSTGCLVFTVEHEGKLWKVGVVGVEAYESLKKHGYKDAEGKVHLQIPQTALKEPIGWINEAY
jgi:hypothetical protein